MDAPQLRRVGPDDTAALYGFYSNLPPDTLLLFRPLGWTPTPKLFHEVCQANLTDTRYDCVLVDGNEIVGWGLLWELDQTYPMLGLGLLPSWHGRGQGKRLMQQLIDEAQRRQRAGLRLIVVETNDRAHALYLRFGFEQTGRHMGDDGLPYREMQKRFRRL